MVRAIALSRVSKPKFINQFAAISNISIDGRQICNGNDLNKYVPYLSTYFEIVIGKFEEKKFDENFKYLYTVY